MYKLYGIDSYCNGGRTSNCVVAALDEEDAVKEFYKDPNCKMYNMITSINEIKGNDCVLLYQIQRSIVDFEEKEWELKEVTQNAAVWGRNEFVLTCKDINKDIKELEFKSSFVHSSGSEIELMICLADHRPNWVTLD